MPFSRSISRIPSMISWLIPLPLVDQVAPHDRVVRDVHFVRLGGEPERPLARGYDLAPEAPPAADVPFRPERDTPADRVPEVRRLAQRALDTGRGDVDRVAVEVAAQEVGDVRAEPMIDTLRVVDVDAEAGRREQLDSEHLDAGQPAL